MRYMGRDLLVTMDTVLPYRCRPGMDHRYIARGGSLSTHPCLPVTLVEGQSLADPKRVLQGLKPRDFGTL